MFNKLLLTFFLIFSSFITIYPSKKEGTKFFDYCYSFEKIISRNSLKKSKNSSNRIQILAEDITEFGINKSKGSLANKIIDQYKTSRNLVIITIIPNKFYCFSGYWIEKLIPGKFASIFYERSKQRINEYNDMKKEIDEFFKDINSEYKSIKKEINDLF